MGFRFRRTIKIAPGIKLNLSKSGVSTTMGKRGLTTTLGKNGAYLNAGVPGTGMSYRTKLFSNKRVKSQSSMEQKKYQNPGCIWVLMIGIIIFPISIALGINIWVCILLFLLIFSISIIMLLLSDEQERGTITNKNDYSDKNQNVLVSHSVMTDNQKRIVLKEKDELLEEAAYLMIDNKTASTSFIQRKLSLDYLRAGRIVDQLEALGIVGSFDGEKPRMLLVIDKEEVKRILAESFQSDEDEEFEEPHNENDVLLDVAFAIMDEEFIDEAFLLGKFEIEKEKMNEIINSLCKSKLLMQEGTVYRVLIHSKRELNELFGTPIDEEYEMSFLDKSFVFAAFYVLTINKISISMLHEKYNIPYIEAESLLTKLEIAKIISPYKKGVGRSLLVKDDESLKKILRKLGIEEELYENIYAEGSIVSKKSNSEKKLEKLIGLESVKQSILSLKNFITIQQARKSQGLKSAKLSYHCVFTGNPGTGKTTVARIVADIYKELGILKKGHLIETDRSGLVAEYMGQTAVKTNAVIDKALDGVLFIDEAYSLVGGQNDYGKEAIATLLKRMEDDRDRLIVILAGYSNEMKTFINANPGLQSRFNRYIDFPDYTSEDLKKIFLEKLKEQQYKIEDDALLELERRIDYEVEHKDCNFGNARFVRNLFEKTIEKQASRISLEGDFSTENLAIIKKEDIA